MFAVFKKEVNSFFSSLTGYIVILVFLISTGLILWVFPGTNFNIPESGYSVLDPLFVLAPWLFLFLIPAVTMRSFAEEKRSGTIELLFTKPLTDLQIVTAKYFAGFLLVVIALIPTLVYFVSIYYLATPTGNIDIAGITGSYIGLFFLCSAFVSIGIFCSVITSNQVVSFLLALLICFFFYSAFDYLASVINIPLLSNMLAISGINMHYVSLSRGVLDTRDLVYFISLSLFFIFLSKFFMERRKWQ